MEKYLPPIIGAVLVLLIVVVSLSIPGGFGPALPSEPNILALPEMLTIMVGIVLAGVVIVVYGVLKVVKPYPGEIGDAFSLILTGIILFLGVTVLDIFIHTGEIGFNRLSHFFWHFSELVGIVFLGLGFKKLSAILTAKKK